jgi:uncharacterized phiE125 gp8 family phage protein
LSENQYALNCSTLPTSEPITLEEVQLHLRVTDASEDDYINALIKSARMQAETYTNRQLMSATWDLYLDRFPCGLRPIELPRCPVTAVSSITYTDSDGATQTWSSANYTYDLYSEPARITLAYQATWPTARLITNSIRVRFTAGYASAALVPAPIKQAMLLMIEAMYKQRDDGEASNQASRNLLDQYRLGDEFTCYGQASYGI